MPTLSRRGGATALAAARHRPREEFWDSVIVPIEQSPGDGTYLLSYGVISHDGHAVKGALSVRVQQ